MKKFLLSVLAAGVLAAPAVAQNTCTATPDACTPSGLIPLCFNPDPAPTAATGEAYDEVINLFASKQTSITSPLPATIYFRRVAFNGISNIPAGLTIDVCHEYGPNGSAGSPECFTAAAPGATPQATLQREDNDPRNFNICMRVTGTPTEANTEADSIDISFSIYVGISVLGGTDTGPGDDSQLGLAGFPNPQSIKYRIPVEVGTSTAKALSANGFEIAPNPTTANARVSFANAAVVGSRLDVFGMDGRLVFTGDVPVGATVVEMPSADFAPGVYVVRLTSGAEVVSKKFVRGE